MRGSTIAVSAVAFAAVLTVAGEGYASTASPPPDANGGKVVGIGVADPAVDASNTREADIHNLRLELSKSPDRYGGVTAKGDQNVSYCDLGSGVDAGVDKAVAKLRQDGASVIRKTCGNSLAALDETLRTIPGSTIFKDNGATLISYGVDDEANVVNVGVDTISDGLRRSVTAVFGDTVSLSISHPLTPVIGRSADSAPFWGGDSISGGGAGCTSGFKAETTTGAAYHVTAGHCWALSTAVSNGSSAYGTVTHRAFSSHSVDAELVSGKVYGAAVYVGAPSSTASLAVLGRTYVSLGNDVYFDGSVTGQAHGFVQDGSSSCQTLDGLISCGLRRVFGNQGQNLCAHGDSGGPVFRTSGSGVLAVGIITALGGDGSDPSDCWYTEIQPILSLWSLEISTP